MSTRRPDALPLLLTLLCALVTLPAGCKESPGERIVDTGCEVYFKPAVTGRDARKTLDFIVSQEMCDGTQKTLQLLRDEGSDDWRLRMVWKPEFLDDEEKLKVMRVFGAQLGARVLNGRVTLELTDDELETLRTVETPDWGRLLTRDKCELYAASDIPDDKAERALSALEEVGCKDHPITFRLERGDGGMALYVVVLQEALADPATLQGWRASAGRVSHAAFDDAPIVVHLTDEWMSPQQSGPGISFGAATKRDGCEIFQGTGATADDASAALAVVHQLGHCATQVTKSYSLAKEHDGSWQLSAVRAANLDPAVVEANRPMFELMATLVRGVLGGEATSYALCDKVFEQCQKFPSPADQGRLFHREGCFVLHPRGDGGYDDATLSALTGVLAREGLCAQKQLLTLTRTEGVHTVKLLAASPDPVKTDTYAKQAKALVRSLQSEVFGGKPTVLLASDATFKELRRFEP